MSEHARAKGQLFQSIEPRITRISRMAYPCHPRSNCLSLSVAAAPRWDLCVLLFATIGSLDGGSAALPGISVAIRGACSAAFASPHAQFGAQSHYRQTRSIHGHLPLRCLL